MMQRAMIRNTIPVLLRNGKNKIDGSAEVTRISPSDKVGEEYSSRIYMEYVRYEIQ